MRYFIALILNAFDGIATATGLSLGLLEEGNPLLSSLPIGALLMVKLVPISLLILWIGNHNEKQISAKGALVICGVYLHIFILHLTWIGAIL
jgi:hypothetical protein